MMSKLRPSPVTRVSCTAEGVESAVHVLGVGLPHFTTVDAGETLGATTKFPPGYGAIRGESPYGTVSNYNVNPPTLYGIQLQFRF